MKKITCLFAMFAAFSLVACSDDDSPESNPSESTYLPLTNAMYWTYNVNGDSQSSRDSVYVANDTVIGSYTYKKIKAQNMPLGFFSNAVNNNALRKDGDAIKLSGSTSIGFTEDFPFSIEVTDLTIFKESAAQGSTIGTVSGTIEQEYEGLPLVFAYTLTTKAGENLDNYIVDGENYNDVKSTQITINLSISYNYQGFPIMVLPAQDVAVATQYYAKNIGMVHSVNDFTYTISSLIADQFGLPATTTEHQEEVLDTYSQIID